MRGMKRVRVVASGRVQGVFYRASCARLARGLGLAGYVRNLPDGGVEAAFEGADAAVDEMVAWSREGPDLANVGPPRRGDRGAPGARRGFRRHRGRVSGADGTELFPLPDARPGGRPLLASTSDVPPLPAHPRLQVVRRQDRPRVRSGRLGHRGTERLGQVEPRRRDQLGARRAGTPGASRRPDGRRDLRRQPAAVRARDGRGQDS